MNYVSDWIDTLCMEWQKQLNDFMIIDGLEDANSSIIAKGALLMDKQKNGEPVSYTHLDVYKRQAGGPHRQVWPYAATLPEGTPARPLQQFDIERKAVPAPVGD